MNNQIKDYFLHHSAKSARKNETPTSEMKIRLVAFSLQSLKNFEFNFINLG